MSQKSFGIFTLILMLNLFTFNIYATEPMIYSDNREYLEIMSQKNEILDSLNRGSAHLEIGETISEDELKMEQAFKVYANIKLNQAEKVNAALQKANYIWQVPVYTDTHTILIDITKVTSISKDVPEDVRMELEKNLNQWHVGSIHIFEEQTVNYAETVKAALENAGYDSENYTYEIVSGIPGIRYPAAIVFNSEEKAEFIIPAEPSATHAFKGNWPTAVQTAGSLSASNEDNDSSMPLYDYNDVARASKISDLFGFGAVEITYQSRIFNWKMIAMISSISVVLILVIKKRKNIFFFQKYR